MLRAAVSPGRPTVFRAPFVPVAFSPRTPFVPAPFSKRMPAASFASTPCILSAPRLPIMKILHDRVEGPLEYLRGRSPYIYRGDYRMPEDIKEAKGLFAKNKNFSLHGHAVKNIQLGKDGFPLKPIVYEPSGYVSFSLSPKAAEEFALEACKTGIVYQAIRSPIITAPFLDVVDKMKPADREETESEAEVAVPVSVPFTDITAYKFADGEAFGPWIKNKHHIPREYSIMIRSADDLEAKRLGQGLPYFYPAYNTALEAAKVLEEGCKEYTGKAPFMTCFEALTEQEVERGLGRAPGSGFCEKDLVKYYEWTYHKIQRDADRSRAKKVVSVSCPGTLFTPHIAAPTPAVAKEDAWWLEDVLRQSLKK